VENDIGHGLADLSLGLRLRYEIHRQFAPYLGVEWEGSFGETANLQRAGGEPVRDTRLVAGVRLWF
jgi:copper resistance protein B